MRFYTTREKYQWFITPSIGVINERAYYGYRVVSIAFGWLCWRCMVQFGVRKVDDWR